MPETSRAVAVVRSLRLCETFARLRSSGGSGRDQPNFSAMFGTKECIGSERGRHQLLDFIAFDIKNQLNYNAQQLRQYGSVAWIVVGAALKTAVSKARKPELATISSDALSSATAPALKQSAAGNASATTESSRHINRTTVELTQLFGRLREQQRVPASPTRRSARASPTRAVTPLIDSAGVSKSADSQSRCPRYQQRSLGAASFINTPK